jgi:hypothetical protein
MEYINYFSEILGEKSENRKPLIDMIRDSNVRRIVEFLGYKFVNIKSGYINTDITDADIYLGGDKKTDNSDDAERKTNSFEWLLLESTAFQGLFDIMIISLGLEDQEQIFLDHGYQEHRKRVLNAFELLEGVPDLPGDNFIFVHIVSPHPPFVFNPDGSEVQNFGVYTVLDGDNFQGGRGDYRENYLQGYVGQVEFISSKIISSLERIIDKSDTPPIIILQADHGPGAYLYWDSIELSDVRERLSILNAYYFPDQNYEMLYPSITPVNTFRVIVNNYFGGSLNLLEDRSYFSLWELPFEFIEVTEQLRR